MESTALVVSSNAKKASTVIMDMDPEDRVELYPILEGGRTAFGSSSSSSFWSFRTTTTTTHTQPVQWSCPLTPVPPLLYDQEIPEIKWRATYRGVQHWFAQVQLWQGRRSKLLALYHIVWFWCTNLVAAPILVWGLPFASTCSVVPDKQDVPDDHSWCTLWIVGQWTVVVVLAWALSYGLVYGLVARHWDATTVTYKRLHYEWQAFCQHELQDAVYRRHGIQLHYYYDPPSSDVTTTTTPRRRWWCWWCSRSDDQSLPAKEVRPTRPVLVRPSLVEGDDEEQGPCRSNKKMESSTTTEVVIGALCWVRTSSIRAMSPHNNNDDDDAELLVPAQPLADWWASAASTTTPTRTNTTTTSTTTMRRLFPRIPHHAPPPNIVEELPSLLHSSSSSTVRPGPTSATTTPQETTTVAAATTSPTPTSTTSSSGSSPSSPPDPLSSSLL